MGKEKMKVILAGNGINRVGNGKKESEQEYSWGKLLDSLVSLAETDIQKDGKPFPLLYEEILMTVLKNKTYTEEDLLNIIVEKVEEIPENDFHKRVTKMFDVILTTNYDYNFEKTLSNDKKYKSATRETLYNLYRCIEIGNKKIWHIHGEANKPKSISLGFERYGANIQKTRNLILSGDMKKGIHSLKKRLSDNENLNIAWVDYFFTENIYIVGLGLDFHEIDLWWLLDYRAREINDGKININNKIVYYCPEVEKKERIQLLKSMYVEVVEIKMDNEAPEHFYSEVLDRIEKEFSK